MKSIKKIILSLSFLLCIMHWSNAQKIYFWIDAGLKANFGPSLYLNKNIFDDRTVNSPVSLGQRYGGKIGINFGSFHAITFDAMYGIKKQSYSFNMETGNYQKAYHVKSLELYPMYRYNRNSNYIEIGAVYNMFQDISKIDIDNTTDHINSFEDYWAPVFGFGYYIAGQERFTTILGLRVSYGFKDILSNAGSESNEITNPNSYADYTPTSAMFAELSLEFNFGLGYYGKSACSKRTKFLSIGR